MSHFTQIFARTARSIQVFGGLRDLDVYLFPPTPAGFAICERTSEAIDVRVIIQVTQGISWRLGPGPAVLAFAGNAGTGFWCGLFEGGKARFQYNRLTGPSNFAEQPVSPEEIEALCRPLGPEVDKEAVRETLTNGRSMSAVDRHAALVRSLGLPDWLPGIGYARIVEGRIPPEAGAPARPPRSLREMRDVITLPEEVNASDPLERFHRTCEKAFGFLEEELGFQKERPYLTDHFPQMVGGTLVIGPGNLRPGYRNAYMLCYRGPLLTVVIEGLSFGARTRLCLVDRKGRHLDLTGLVKRRSPELIDLCVLAAGQSEQIPMYAEALRKCGSGVLAGDLSEISPIGEIEPGFSFSAFSTQSDGDYILALAGPRGGLRTIWAKMRRALLLRKLKARVGGS